MARGDIMKITEYADREMLAMQVADMLASDLQNSLLTNDRVSFAVPGGTTPGPIFDILCGIALDWNRVDILLTDERWVPENHAMSNTQLLRTRLLTGPAAKAHLIPFYRPDLTAAQGAKEVAQTLMAHMPLSLLVLGMGADMHTASLFPGAGGVKAAFANTAPLLCPIEVEGQGFDRVTLPAHALKGAMSTHLVIYGDDKRTALERTNTLPPEEAPIGAVLGKGTVHWAA
jgi:6-phosphogluconolactonase